MDIGNQLILNRENNSLPADNFYMVARKGEFPVVVETADRKNKVLLQVIDDVAISAMANRFVADKTKDPTLELLVDQDHFSENEDKPSEAFGWITSLQNRADGLWAQIAWTDAGESSVRNKRYRFLSPVWEPKDCEDLGNRRIRPMRLDKAAVTNEPNIKGMTPLKNRKQNPAAGIPDSGGKDKMEHKPLLLQLLGLAAEASDEQITAGIAAHTTEIQNRKTELETIKNRFTELEAKELEGLVEKDLDTHKDKIVNRAEMKAALIANRAATLKVLESIVIPVPPSNQKLMNRENAKTPEVNEAEAIKNRKANQDTLIEKIMNDRRCSSRAQAYEIAHSQQPDLFA